MTIEHKLLVSQLDSPSAPVGFMLKFIFPWLLIFGAMTYNVHIPGNVITVVAIYFLYCLYKLVKYIFSPNKDKKLVEDYAAQINSDFKNFIGNPTEYFFTGVIGGFECYTAQGIAYGDGVLYMMRNGVAAKIPLEDIRDWTWRIEGYARNKVYGNNLGLSLEVARDNRAAMRAAAFQSGFFVSVKDAQVPEWHFVSTDKNQLQRLDEMLTQAAEKFGNKASIQEPINETRPKESIAHPTFCTQCGTSLGANQVFCGGCGAKMAGAVA